MLVQSHLLTKRLSISLGNRYRNIQGHRSQSDWPPSGTPALWENLGSGGGYQPSYDQPPPQQQQQQHYEPPKYDNPPQGNYFFYNFN